MSIGIVLALVLLPVAMYGLAWLLAACRSWLGVSGVPRARRFARAILQASGGAMDGRPTRTSG
jgi:hypothetical protein